MCVILFSGFLTLKDETKGKDKEQWLDVINNELENHYSNNIMTFVKTIPPMEYSSTWYKSHIH